MSDTAVLNGYERYLTSDEVRTQVGVVRHKASRRVRKERERFGETFLTVSNFLKSRKEEKLRSSQQSPEATLQRAFDGVSQALVHLTNPNLFHLHVSVPVRKRSWWERAWLALVKFFVAYVRVGDPDWHRTVRQAAWTALLWAFTVSSILVLGKGVLWVLNM